MQALRLIKLNNYNIDFNLGKEIGVGADGQLFELIDDFNKVIKFSVVYEVSNLEKIEKNNSTILNYLINNPLSHFVKVYHYSLIGLHKRQIYGNQEQRYIIYYYLMEKLNKISEDEKKVFTTLLSHEDSNKVKDYSLNKVKDILYGLSLGLEFDNNKVMQFYNAINNSPIIHLDIHSRNIMKDSFDNFKLIDLDHCKWRK